MPDTADWCVPATFTRGGFSHERKFHVPAPDGGTYTGIAQVYHCLDGTFRPLPAEDPGDAEALGYLAVRPLEPVLPHGLVLVNCPDGDNLEVDTDQLRPVPKPVDDLRVLRLHAAILAALPYIQTPHVRATLTRAVEETGGRAG
jgi:hypothetical protein